MPSGLPADFFDTGVKKKFYGKGDEPMYDLSDEEDLPPIEEATDQTNGRPKIVIDKIIPAAPAPAGLPSGELVKGGELV